MVVVFSDFLADNPDEKAIATYISLLWSCLLWSLKPRTTYVDKCYVSHSAFPAQN